jgi:predicted AAA+ superfamily ATPase
MEELFYRYNPWWEDDFKTFDSIIERSNHLFELKSNLIHKQILFLTGLRRIGKTSLMKLCIKELIHAQKIDPKFIFYISLDDYVLREKSIIEIISLYRQIKRISYSKKIYIFLDEITEVADYEIQLKNLYDSGTVKVIASSSSASLLKANNDYLTGRKIIIEILPLSFNEYLLFKKIHIKKADEQLREVYFKDFLLTGGIPEYVLTGNDAYIRELMDDIIYKDIAAVNGIRHIDQLKSFFLLLMERSGKTLSINKIAKILGISTETSKRYFDLFCDTYIIYPVSRHGSLNERLVSPKKIYACDLGIKSYYHGERDWGSLFENYVFLRLKQFNLTYIYENSIELDFFTDDKQLIECKFHQEPLSDKQQKLFNSTNAKNKTIIRSEQDIETFLKRAQKTKHP